MHTVLLRRTLRGAVLAVCLDGHRAARVDAAVDQLGKRDRKRPDVVDKVGRRDPAQVVQFLERMRGRVGGRGKE